MYIYMYTLAILALGPHACCCFVLFGLSGISAILALLTLLYEFSCLGTISAHWHSSQKVQ